MEEKYKKIYELISPMHICYECKKYVDIKHHQDYDEHIMDVQINGSEIKFYNVIRHTYTEPTTHANIIGIGKWTVLKKRETIELIRDCKINLNDLSVTSSPFRLRNYEKAWPRNVEIFNQLDLNTLNEAVDISFNLTFRCKKFCRNFRFKVDVQQKDINDRFRFAEDSFKYCGYSINSDESITRISYEDISFAIPTIHESINKILYADVKNKDRKIMFREKMQNIKMMKDIL